MKKQINSLLIIVVLMIVCFVIVGCTKRTATTTIYGTVFDSYSHEPVAGAEVEVGIKYNGIPEHYRLSSSVSGSDGHFELLFDDIHHNYDREFVFYISASGTYEILNYSGYAIKPYKNYYEEIGVEIGGNYQVDINLKRQ